MQMKEKNLKREPKQSLTNPDTNSPKRPWQTPLLIVLKGMDTEGGGGTGFDGGTTDRAS
jgi:hypothetical protein